MITVVGKIKRFRFNPAKGRNSFGVAVLEADSDWLRDVRTSQNSTSVLPANVDCWNITVAGEMPLAKEGASYEMTGQWTTHEQYGPQLTLISFSLVSEKLPQTEGAIEKWLAVQVAGVGAGTARKIMQAMTAQEFLLQFADRDKNDTEVAKNLLALVSGLRASQAQSVVETWREVERETDPDLAKERQARRDLSLFLFAGGLTANTVAKAIRKWGTAETAFTVVKQNPYMLTELSNVGFAQADKLALASKIVDEFSHYRIAAAAKHVIAQECGARGNVYVPYGLLRAESVRLLKINEEAVHAFFFQASGSDVYAQMNTYGVQLFFTDDLKTPAILESTVSESSRKNDTTTKVFLYQMWRSEDYIAKALVARSRYKDEQGRVTTPARWVTQLQGTIPNELHLKLKLQIMGYKDDRALNSQQMQSILTAIQNPVSILTGGPGTGKTTTCRALVELLYQYAGSSMRVALAAPTGKASRRMSQAFSGIVAPNGSKPDPQTIHRLLGLFGGGDEATAYADSVASAFDADFVILDEASMVDEPLMSALLAALKSGTHLVLVGDENQLPSVGVGQVLSDILAAQIIPTTRLQTIYRQRATSAIVANAAAITAGRLPRWGDDIDDFFFIEAETPLEIQKAIISLIQDELPELGFYLQTGDVQVLTPQRNTDCGVDALNTALQAELNYLVGDAELNPSDYQIELAPNFVAEKDAEKPDSSVEQAESDQFKVAVSKRSGAKRKVPVFLRVADPVMFCRNDYKKKVMNGDTGRVLAVYPSKKTVVVKLDVPNADGFDEIEYNGAELDDLTLAYALTVHKSQGSEYPIIIMPLTTSHYMMLKRELLYTAVTRGKRYVFLVGTRQALQTAVRSSNARKRLTALTSLLGEAYAA